MDIPATMDELEPWLAALDPITRARFLSVVTDTRNLGKLGAWRKAAVFEAAQEETQAAVAEKLGVATKSVSKAVYEHRLATKE